MYNVQQHLGTQARNNPKRKRHLYPNLIWSVASLVRQRKSEKMRSVARQYGKIRQRREKQV